MSIVQQGALNTTALVVPDLYVQIVAPQNLVLNGVPTNILGVVGSAQWGPVGQPVIVSSMADYARNFGAIQNRTYDMGTQVATAVMQGASNFRCVRATDGTDAAATSLVLTNCITFTAAYTGTLGNSLTATITNGTKASSYKLVLGLPGQVPEVYDNLTGAGNALWVAMAAAVNAGSGALRGPSLLCTAAAGAGVTAPTGILNTAQAFSGGSDGVTSMTAAVCIGVDTIPRKGMYALRGQGCTIGLICTADDSYANNYATWTTQATFGLSEGIYMITCGPSGDSIATAVANKATAALDSYAVKLMFGDWCYWSDPVNALMRLVSPQGFVAGRLANLSPQNSSLNKPIYGIVDTQKSGLNPAQNTAYSTAELTTLFQAGIDVISTPQPGGSYYGCRLGHNSSSNAAINGDNYTRMTNYVAATINAGMGLYVGQVINSTLFQRIRSTLLGFFQNLFQQGLLGSLDGTSLPFSVVCDTSNNPFSRTSLGYVQADCQVQYQAINEKFLVNIEGGQTVNVLKQTTSSGQTTA